VDDPAKGEAHVGGCDRFREQWRIRRYVVDSKGVAGDDDERNVENNE
jgi:hypothetical protein